MKRAQIFGLLFAVTVLVMPAIASASAQNFEVAGAAPQQGMLMSLTDNSNVVEPASTKNASSLVGIIGSDESNLAKQVGQYTVKNDGVVNALVSTLDGNIGVGDRIAASSLQGIGTKVTKSSWIVGVAQASLDAKAAGAISTMVTDSEGGKHEVFVATIPVLVKITYYAVPSKAEVKPTTVIPKPLQDVADAVAGKHVSVLSLILSFLLLIVGIIAAVAVVVTTIRNGFIAIGRQPLAKAVVFRKELQSFGMAAVVLVAVVLGALLLLRVL